jgi:hypothetical protein
MRPRLLRNKQVPVAAARRSSSPRSAFTVHCLLQFPIGLANGRVASYTQHRFFECHLEMDL